MMKLVEIFCYNINTRMRLYILYIHIIKYQCKRFVHLLQHGLISHALRLAHNCLTFDFIGTSTDETADDLCTVQIPTGWRSGKVDSKRDYTEIYGVL